MTGAVLELLLSVSAFADISETLLWTSTEAGLHLRSPDVKG